MTVTAADLLNYFVPRAVDAGMSDEDARRVVAQFVASDFLGRHGHGVYRMAGVLGSSYRSSEPNPETRAGHLTLNASGRPGIAAIVDACDIAADAIKSSGSLTVAVGDYVGTTGSLGWFAYMLAERGIGSVSVCNSIYAVALPGTGIPFGGTNPIAFGVPGEPHLIADYASTVMSYGDLRMNAMRGEELADGVVVASDGQPSNRYEDADDGAMLGFGGHKGHVQSVVIEVLCGLLAGSKVGLEDDRSDGTVMFLFDTAGAARPDAVAATRLSMMGAAGTSRMSGEAYSQVPSDFLWNGEANSEWANSAEIQLPSHVSDFLVERGLPLPS